MAVIWPPFGAPKKAASEQTTTPQTATVAVGIEGGCFGALAGRVVKTRPAA
jgi:hypothetical protein